MSTVLSVILLILAMVIFAFLTLPSGLFAIFYHTRLAKTTAKKADDQSLSFILGTEIFATFIWLLIYIIVFIIFYNIPDFEKGLFPFILSGICFAEAIAFTFFYFRPKKKKASTALFLPRRIAKNLILQSDKAKNRSDCIALGFIANFPELIFSLPIFIISAVILQNTSALPRTLIIIIFVITSAVPLFIVRHFYHTGHNLADIQRLRVKLRSHIRIILALAYFAVALVMLNIGIIQNG